MRMARVIVTFGLAGIAAGCARDRGAAAAADSTRIADSIRMADSVRLAQTTDSAAHRAASLAAAQREPLVKVTEQVPGLLAQAKILPIDAQHLAQTKYPEGKVLGGTIERRAGNLVYVFDIQQKDVAGSELVLINANDGLMLDTIHKEATVARKP